jgi:hypothetical protein
MAIGAQQITATATKVPVSSDNWVKPMNASKFRGDTERFKIVFNTSLEGDRVGGLVFTFKCFGDNYPVNLSRYSLKLDKSTFSFGSEGLYTQGTFITPTKATGIVTYEITKGDEKCKFQGEPWEATLK